MFNTAKEWLYYFFQMCINMAVCLIILQIYTYIGMVILSIDYSQVSIHLRKVGQYFGEACEFATNACFKKVKQQEL